MSEIKAKNVVLKSKINGEETPLNPRTAADMVSYNNSTVAAELAALRAAVGGKTTTYVVEDIVARNALTGMNPGDQAWVTDATGDNTVASGAAKYIWVGGEINLWSKTAEAESMDIVHDWALIQGKPTTPVADLDDSAAKRHSHANAAVLTSLGKDASGKLTVDGAVVSDGQLDSVTINAGDPVPEALREGGIIFEIQTAH